jgi:hypothetical protein
MICGPVAATVGLFNDKWQYINTHRFLPVLYTLPLSTCVSYMHVPPPLMYIAMDCIIPYVFSLSAFKQMDAPTCACIYSFFLTLTRSKTMFSHDQIGLLINPKSYGLVHDVCVKKICLL